MRLPFMPRDGLCRKCGRDAAGLDGEFLCQDCRTHKPHFDRAASVFRFTGDARELVNAFKFRERLELRDDLVDFLEGLARAHFRVEEIDCVVPVPSTLGHRILRGYNQCAELAKPLAKRLGKPCLNLLKRVGCPKRQGGLGEAERRENVIDTFKCRPEIKRIILAKKGTRHSCRVKEKSESTILLVDDIMSTGSMLSEAAKTLKEAGVGRVWTIALARSIRA